MSIVLTFMFSFLWSGAETGSQAVESVRAALPCQWLIPVIVEQVLAILVSAPHRDSPSAILAAKSIHLREMRELSSASKQTPFRRSLLNF